MNIRRITLGAAFLAISWACLRADPRDGEIVRGQNFEGVIFTPEMIRTSDSAQWLRKEGPNWTPSRALVLKAEAALPAAIAYRIRFAIPERDAGYPTYFTAKNRTRPPYSNNAGPEAPHDSDVTDNFLYDLDPSLLYSQKRQYIGITVNGKRQLLMSFVYPDTTEVLPKWKHEWIEALDGGYLFWYVLYDPATGQFSHWECNGYA